jgi:hypothetical protein
MVFLKQEKSWKLKGNIQNLLKYIRKEKHPFIKKYGQLEHLNFFKNENEINSWTSIFNLPLNINPTLLNLINYHKMTVKRKIFIVDNKLIIQFCSSKYISNFIQFTEEIIYENISDNFIKITRNCFGENKVKNWLVGPLCFLISKSEIKKIETDFEQQQIDLINQEIYESNQ